MKNIITLLCFICVNLQAQNIIIPIENTSEHTLEDNHYYKDVNNLLDKYTGTWIFDNGIDYFEIVFYVEQRVDVSLAAFGLSGANQYFMDELHSRFIYRKNGIEIYNTIGTTTHAIRACFTNTFIFSSNKLGCIYKEPTPFVRVQRAHLDLEYIQGGLGSPDEMIWTRTDLPNKSLLNRDGNGNLPANVDFKIPTNMTLVKQ
jgi:hypothetical protein